ncbi:MAG: Rid family detoxifying hydrolase [Gemmatimonadaceae bacterium]
MPRNPVVSSRAPTPLGAYSPGVWAGDLLFLSGQTPVDPETGRLVDGDVEAQTHQALTNLEGLLGDAGLTMDDVIKCNVFITSMTHFAGMNTAYKTRFSKPYPARTTVAIAGLPLGATVEIELVAKRPETPAK